MNNFPRYDSYKDSGVDWLGEVPTHWETLANKYIFTLKKNQVGKRSNEYELLSLTLTGIIKRDMENPQGKFPAEFDTYQEVKEGDFVFCLFDVEETPRTVGLSDFDGMITGAYTVLQPNEDFDKKFLYYFYLNLDADKRMKPLYTGLRNTISKENFFSFKTFVPPISEQTVIAEFLDRKTAQIDQAIAQKERLIELLQERRQILIHNAVTRGLNANVKMKHSGVDWIGEIPEHWEVNKLGYNLDILSGYAFPSSGFKESGVKLLRGINVSIGTVRWDEVVYWSEEKTKNLEQYYLNADDVVFGMDRPFITGGMRIAVVITEDLPCLLLQRVTRIRAINGLTQEYLLLILKSNLFIDYFTPILSGVSVPHISPSQISSFKCCIPRVSEQKEIVDYIANVSIKIEKAVSCKQKEIKKLKEYKAVLINSAVTGKIKVFGNNQNAEMKTNYAKSNE